MTIFSPLSPICQWCKVFKAFFQFPRGNRYHSGQVEIQYWLNVQNMLIRHRGSYIVVLHTFNLGYAFSRMFFFLLQPPYLWILVNYSEPVVKSIELLLMIKKYLHKTYRNKIYKVCAPALSDLSKALDCLEHQLVIARLHAFEFNHEFHFHLTDKIQIKNWFFGSYCMFSERRI